MGALERFLFVTVMWVGAPLLLIVLAVGPRRFWKAVKRARALLWQRRLDPETVLTHVVKEQQGLVEGLKDALARAEAAARDIAANIQRSEESIAALESEALERATVKDELGARAVLYKLNLERAAVEAFRQQLGRQREPIEGVRKNLYLVELQLRQYEVGRTILLSQLAEAKTVEQQTAIAAQFDPFNAVANWKQAEGMVQEKALSARAAERVYADLLDVPSANRHASVDPKLLEAQLEDLRVRAALKNTQSETSR
jgi:phage shock protein A